MGKLGKVAHVSALATLPRTRRAGESPCSYPLHQCHWRPAFRPHRRLAVELEPTSPKVGGRQVLVPPWNKQQSPETHGTCPDLGT
jgi:hypothetical protein